MKLAQYAFDANTTQFCDYYNLLCLSKYTYCNLSYLKLIFGFGADKWKKKNYNQIDWRWRRFEKQHIYLFIIIIIKSSDWLTGMKSASILSDRIFFVQSNIRFCLANSSNYCYAIFGSHSQSRCTYKHFATDFFL